MVRGEVHVSRERFWIDTNSNFDPSSRKKLLAVFVYDRRSGLDEATSFDEREPGGPARNDGQAQKASRLRSSS